MGGKTWTPEKDELLRQVWFQPGPLKLHCDKFGRTVGAMKDRGYTLGLPHREKSLYMLNFSWVIEAALRELERGPMHARQISKRIGACLPQTQRMLRRRHGSGIYIFGWVKVSEDGTGPWSAVWAIGNGPDVPKPEAVSGIVRQRAWREKRLSKRNPFAAAAGLVSAPKTGAGRVYIHLHDDELEAA